MGLFIVLAKYALNFNNLLKGYNGVLTYIDPSH